MHHLEKVRYSWNQTSSLVRALYLSLLCMSFLSLGNGESETHVVYANLKRTVNLKCSTVEFRSTPKVKWYKVQNPSQSQSQNELDMDTVCVKKPKPDEGKEKEGKAEDLKCSFVHNLAWNTSSSSKYNDVLRIKDLTDQDYGQYECRNGSSGSVLRKFVVRGDLKATRKSPHDPKETERSVFVREGENLYLYCNYSEAESNRYTDISKYGVYDVIWYKDGKDITEELQTSKNGSLFEEFKQSKTDPNLYRGRVTNDHKGVYNCSVVLGRNVPKSEIHENEFPVSFKFTVRVREKYSWVWPGGILLVEILGLAIFTAVIWRKDETKIKKDDDVAPEDSEEDEEPKSKL